MSLSIFKKKGTVESLFRIGLGGEEEARPTPAIQADAASDDASKHQVFLVRGRPFIANARGAGGPPAPTPCLPLPALPHRMPTPSTALFAPRAGPGTPKKREQQ